jgi:lipid A 4'-phosphatase
MIPMRPLLLAGLLLAGLFIAFPGIDLWASALFHTPGAGFVLTGNRFFDGLHKNLEILVVPALTLALAYLLLGGWRHAPAWLAGKRKQAGYMLLVAVIGPGLLVNSLFKDQWGRARPNQVTQFEGTRQFTPAWLPSDQCPRNCSFVCGDASVGFAVLGFGFVSRRPRRWLFAGLALGGALGVMRMAQGGHFLSDVIFSFFVVYLAAWLLHRWLFNNPMESKEK